MTALEVKQLVSGALTERTNHLEGLHIVGMPELRDRQWQVLIEPFRWEPAPRFTYYEMLGEVEDEILDRTGLSVFLTPAPEATYRVGDERIDVARRDSCLFVSPAASTEVFGFYSLDGRFENAPSAVGSKQRTSEEYWLPRFEDAVRQYLADQQDREAREKAIMALKAL